MQVGSSLSRPRIGRTPTAKGLWMKWPFHSDLIWPSALFFEPSRSARRPSDVADWICDNKLHYIHIHILVHIHWSIRIYSPIYIYVFLNIYIYIYLCNSTCLIMDLLTYMLIYLGWSFLIWTQMHNSNGLQRNASVDFFCVSHTPYTKLCENMWAHGTTSPDIKQLNDVILRAVQFKIVQDCSYAFQLRRVLCGCHLLLPRNCDHAYHAAMGRCHGFGDPDVLYLNLLLFSDAQSHVEYPHSGFVAHKFANYIACRSTKYQMSYVQFMFVILTWFLSLEYSCDRIQ